MTALAVDLPSRVATAGLEMLAPESAAWSELVAACPDSMPFHHPSWIRLLAECYGYEAFILGRRAANGALDAGIPALKVTSPLGRRRWISLPFTDYCPPLIAPGAARSALIDGLGDSIRRSSVPQLEVRAPIEGDGITVEHAAVMHMLSLSSDPEAAFRSFHKSQVQRNIRRAEREGVTVRFGQSMDDLVDTFYRFHLQTRRRQGVPIQPRRFFELLWRRVLEPGHGFVLLAHSGSTPIAGAVFLTCNQTITYKYGASDPAFWGLRPNHLIFWNAIQHACEHGYTRFDFGRTDFENESLREFKSGWGAAELPLDYAYVGEPPGSHRTAQLSHALGAVIRRSPPWVCRALGELLYKYAA